MRLDGKVALVTGGSSGIGLATARRFVAEGATVIITGRDQARLAEAQQDLGGTVQAVAGDLCVLEDIDRMVGFVRERHRALDVLVVNAGVANAPRIEEIDLATYSALMDVNCRGAVFTSARALPLLAAGASVVFVGSVAGRKGQPGDALYAGSKGFIRAFARTLGTDPAILSRGIRVNVVAPGPIDTPLTAGATADPDADAYVRRLVPQNRWGRPEEVANAILFLASLEASFMTGAEITVDGGMAHA